MSDELFALGQCEMGDESVAFATEAGAYTYFEVEEDALDLSGLKRPHHENGSMRQVPGALQRLAPAAEVVEGDFGFSQKMHSFSTSVPTAAPAAAHPQATLIGRAMGSIQLAGWADDDTQAGCTTAKTVTSDASSFKTGQLFVVNTGAAPTVRYEGRFAQDIDLGTDEIKQHPQHVWELAPEAGKDVWGSITCYHERTFAATNYSQSFKFQNDAELIKMLGCRCREFSISGEYGQIPMLAMTWAVARMPAPSSPSMSLQTYAYPDAHEFTDAFFSMTTDSTAYTIDCSSMSVTYTNDLQPSGSASARYRVKDWRKGPGCRATIEFTTQFNSNFRALWESRTAHYIELVVGRTAGQMWGLRIPKAHIADFGPRAESNAFESQSFTFEMANDYTADVGVGDTADTLFQIGFA